MMPGSAKAALNEGSGKIILLFFPVLGSKVKGSLFFQIGRIDISSIVKQKLNGKKGK